MFILASGMIGQQPRVTYFKNEKKSDMEKITSTIKVPFIVLEIGEISRNDLNSLIAKIVHIGLEEILAQEARKFIKKKYNIGLNDILDNIIQIG